VEDERAYLSITVDDRVNTVQVRNQFTDDLDLTVTLESVDDGVDKIEVDGSITFVDRTMGDGDIEVDDHGNNGVLGSGEDTHIRVEFDEMGDISFTLSFDGEASGASVDKTREFTLGPEDVTDHVTKVKFQGSSNGNSDKIRILTGESNGNSGVDGVARAKLYCKDNDGEVTSNDEFGYVPVNTKLGVSNFDDGLEGSIAGVEVDIPEVDGIFKRPDSPGNGRTVSKHETEIDPFDG